MILLIQVSNYGYAQSAASVDPEYVNLVKKLTYHAGGTCVPNSVHNISIFERDKSGKPAVLYGEFRLTDDDGKIKAETIKVLLSNGSPYGVTFGSAPNTCHVPAKAYVTGIVGSAYTHQEKMQMQILQAKFLCNQVAKKHKQYSATSLNLQYLVPATYYSDGTATRDKVTYEMEQNQNGQSLVKVTRPEKYETTIEERGLKNISRHNLVIRAYSKVMLNVYGTIIYDASIIIKPGEVIGYESVKDIQPSFNLDDYIDQPYFFVPIGRLPESIVKKYQVSRQPVVNEDDYSDTEVTNTKKSNVVAKKIGNLYEINSNTNTTNINVAKGDKLTITASGRITFGFFAGSGDAYGIDGYEEYSIVEGVNHGALLYRIGNGAWRGVGTKISITAPVAGKLQFMVNDNDPSNNEGAFYVSIQKR